MEFLGLLIGAGIVAVSPLVPALRPAAKAVIKGGMALTEMSKGAAASVAAQWVEIVSDTDAETEDAPAGQDAEVTAEAEAEDAAVMAEAETEDAPAGQDADVMAEAEAEDAPAGQDGAVTSIREADVSEEIPVVEGSVQPEPQSASAGDGQAETVSSARKSDDLTKVKGIGPKIAAWLNDSGITTYEQLAGTDVDQLKQQLMSAGRTYRAAEPAAWADQARELAAERV